MVLTITLMIVALASFTWLGIAMILYFKEDCSGALRVFGVFFTLVITIYLDALALRLGLTYGESSGRKERSSSASVHEVSEYFGLKSGEKYPLAIQDTFGGSTGSISARSGFFTANASASMKLDTAVSLGFNHEDSGWLLTLPTHKITYLRATDEEPGVIINLYDLSGTGYDFITLCSDRKLVWSFVPHYRYETCSTPELVYEDSTLLPSLVSSNFMSATIYLPPEEYDEMFNRQ